MFFIKKKTKVRHTERWEKFEYSIINMEYLRRRYYGNIRETVSSNHCSSNFLGHIRKVNKKLRVNGNGKL